jgi:isopentenyl diphosphate isomerase/L-lactate dehydrogenase-like FMN-dependent dehydrogenase
MSLPVVLGTVGMAGMYSSRGEVKAANPAKAAGIAFTLSTMGVWEVNEVAHPDVVIAKCTTGWRMPQALGAQAAFPRRQVISLSGDGASR